jgi:hypothetical protein
MAAFRGFGMTGRSSDWRGASIRSHIERAGVVRRESKDTRGKAIVESDAGQHSILRCQRELNGNLLRRAS